MERDAIDLPDLYRIVYRSRAIRPQGDWRILSDIRGILRTSRAWNHENDITGALMLTHKGYAQVLEGPAGAVKELFGRISADARHKDVDLLRSDFHNARDFGNWSMAFTVGPGQRDVELASTAYRRPISVSHGADDILVMLRWLLIERVKGQELQQRVAG